MKSFALAAAVLALAAGQAAAICPGFNYGVGNQQNLGSGVSRCTSPLSRRPSPPHRVQQR